MVINVLYASIGAVDVDIIIGTKRSVASQAQINLSEKRGEKVGS